MNGETQAVQSLWRQVAALRAGGLSEAQAFHEVGQLLFLKLRQESAGARDWPGPAQLDAYRRLLRESAASSRPLIAAYAGAETRLRDDAQLADLVEAILDLDWTPLRDSGLPELFEAFLEKYAADSAEGWRLFTPATLVNALIGLLQPQPGETVLDPVAGAGCFLMAADAYMQAVLADEAQDKSGAPSPPEGRLLGLEPSPELRRLAAMSLALHQVPQAVLRAAPLSEDPAADVLCGNLLIGCAGDDWLTDSEAAAEPDEDALLVAELEHEARLLRDTWAMLKAEGRAALIVSDDLLYADLPALRELRRDLLDTCNLHTLLRLPSGILYGQDIPANVLFFTRNGPTRTLWVYDMRNGLPCFDTRHTPFSPRYLTPFESVFGDDPRGGAAREDGAADDRFRAFSRAELAEDGDNLDIFWREDETPGTPEMPTWIGEELRALEDLLQVRGGNPHQAEQSSK